MTIAFIPVRGGSKSIPLKNIKDLCGFPLIYWNLAALEQAVQVDRIIVATDSIEIKAVVEEYSFTKVEIYDRDPENASDTASTESVMLEYINKKRLSDEDVFILVQATSPFTRTEDFNKALELMSNDKYDSLLSCVRNKRFFWNDNGTSINYDYRKRPRRQDFDGYLMENGAFYINKVGNIKRDNNRLSGKIGIFEMAEYTGLEIDEKEDWIIAETLMKNKVIQNYTKKDIKLFLSDVDGTLTDAGMYYDQKGNELKKFNTRDGKGFELLLEAGIKTGMITSENTEIVKNMVKKLKIDYLFQNVSNKEKLDIVKNICGEINISLENVAYIGDDINSIEILKAAGYSACPSDAVELVKKIAGIQIMSKMGGNGAVREFIDIIINYQS